MDKVVNQSLDIYKSLLSIDNIPTDGLRYDMIMDTLKHNDCVAVLSDVDDDLFIQHIDIVYYLMNQGNNSSDDVTQHGFNRLHALNSSSGSSSSRSKDSLSSNDVMIDEMKRIRKKMKNILMYDDINDHEVDRNSSLFFSNTKAVLEESQKMKQSLVNKSNDIKIKHAQSSTKIQEAMVKQMERFQSISDNINQIEKEIDDVLDKAGPQLEDILSLSKRNEHSKQTIEFIQYLLEAKKLSAMQQQNPAETLSGLYKLYVRIDSISMTTFNHQLLLKYIKSEANRIWKNAQPLLTQKLQSAIDKLQWPNTQVTTMNESEELIHNFNEAFKNLLQSQISVELIHFVSDKNQASAFIIKGKIVGDLLAITQLMKPISLRFLYHFATDKGTNNVYKPEASISYCLQMMRMNISFLQQNIQNVANDVSKYLSDVSQLVVDDNSKSSTTTETETDEIDKTLLDLNLLSKTNASKNNKSDQRSKSKATPPKSIDIDILLHCCRIIVKDCIHHRLKSVFDESLIDNSLLLTHTLDELLVGDQVLIEEFGYVYQEKNWPLFSSFFFSDENDEYTSSWIKADGDVAKQRMRSIMHSHSAWQYDLEGDNSSVECANAFIQLVDALGNRCFNIKTGLALASRENRVRFTNEVIKGPMIKEIMTACREKIMQGVGKEKHLSSTLSDRKKIRFIAMNALQMCINWFKDRTLDARFADLLDTFVPTMNQNDTLINRDNIIQSTAEEMIQASDSFIPSGIVGGSSMLRELGVTDVVHRALNKGKSLIKAKENESYRSSDESNMQLESIVHDGGIFADEIILFEKIRNRGYFDVIEDVFEIFISVFGKYVNRSNSLRMIKSINIQDQNELIKSGYDFTPEIQRCLEILLSQLNSIHDHLLSQCGKEIASGLAERIGNHVHRHIIENKMYTYFGACQISHDIHGLFRIFDMFSKKPENAYQSFRKLRESLIILSTPEQQLVSLRNGLSGMLDSWDGHDVIEETEMRSMLQATVSVYIIHPSDAVKLIEQRSDIKG